MVLLLLGCLSSQKAIVYERLPQFQECMRYTDFFEVTNCDKAELKKQNAELEISLDESKQRLGSLYNQGDRCAYRYKLSRPVGCDISIVPRRGNRPVVGRGIKK